MFNSIIINVPVMVNLGPSVFDDGRDDEGETWRVMKLLLCPIGNLISIKFFVEIYSFGTEILKERCRSFCCNSREIRTDKFMN